MRKKSLWSQKCVVLSEAYFLQSFRSHGQIFENKEWWRNKMQRKVLLLSLIGSCHKDTVVSSLFGRSQDVGSVLHTEACHPELEEWLVFLPSPNHLQKFLSLILRATPSCLGKLEQHLHLAVKKQLVSWCFEPSPPQRITSGLTRNM